MQSLTSPLSVGYVGFHWTWSRLVTESGITDGYSGVRFYSSWFQYRFVLKCNDRGGVGSVARLVSINRSLHSTMACTPIRSVVLLLLEVEQKYCWKCRYNRETGRFGVQAIVALLSLSHRQRQGGAPATRSELFTPI